MKENSLRVILVNTTEKFYVYESRKKIGQCRFYYIESILDRYYVKLFQRVSKKKYEDQFMTSPLKVFNIHLYSDYRIMNGIGTKLPFKILSTTDYFSY